MSNESIDTTQHAEVNIVTVNVSHPGTDAVIELPTSTEGHTDSWAALINAPESQSAFAWVVENTLSTVFSERTVDRIKAYGTRVGRLILGESTRSEVFAEHEVSTSWHDASRFVRKTQAIIGERKKVPKGWIRGRFFEPYTDIPNYHTPGTLIAVPAGTKAVYTRVSDIETLQALFPDITISPNRTYDIAVFPPFTKVQKDNYMDGVARFTTSGFTQIAVNLRLNGQNGNKSAEIGSRFIKQAESTESEARALVTVAKQTYEEMDLLRRKGLPNSPL